MDYFIELLFSGLTRGAIYALIALGYTMVYGIIGLINFAHGEIYMIGAFTALIVATVRRAARLRFRRPAGRPPGTASSAGPGRCPAAAPPHRSRRSAHGRPQPAR